MSFCRNCGSSVREGSVFCYNCGARYVVEEETGQKSPDTGAGSGSKSRGIIIVFVVVLVIFSGITAFCYLSAKNSYDLGINKLDLKEWKSANSCFTEAKRKGIVFFQDGFVLYDQKINEFGREQIDKANEMFDSGNYQMVKELIAGVPEESSYFSDVKKIEEKIGKEAQNKLDNIQNLIDGENYDEAEKEVNEFRKIFNFDKYSLQADEKEKFINNGIDEKAAAEEKAAETTAAAENVLETAVDTPAAASTLISLDGWNVTASSYLKEATVEHLPAFICDGDLTTAWVEGAADYGIGERVILDNPEEKMISAIRIVNGYAKSSSLYYENSRVKRLGIEFSDGSSIEKELGDNRMDYQEITLAKPVKSKSIKITILDVYNGSKYSDTCISEVSVIASDVEAAADFILPFSSERKLTETDISKLSVEQIGIARNEIYARHGYIFKTDKYKTYFENKPWYKPSTSFKEEDLNEIEKYNTVFLKDHE